MEGRRTEGAKKLGKLYMKISYKSICSFSSAEAVITDTDSTNTVNHCNKGEGKHIVPNSILFNNEALMLQLHTFRFQIFI